METKDRVYKITIENTITKEKFQAKCDYAIVHVANMLDNGLLQTHTFNQSQGIEENFRMLLSLARAIQDYEFGHINPKIGEICEETDLIKEVI